MTIDHNVNLTGVRAHRVSFFDRGMKDPRRSAPFGQPLLLHRRPLLARIDRVDVAFANLLDDESIPFQAGLEASAQFSAGGARPETRFGAVDPLIHVPVVAASV